MKADDELSIAKLHGEYRIRLATRTYDIGHCLKMKTLDFILDITQSTCRQYYLVSTDESATMERRTPSLAQAVAYFEGIR